MDNTQGTTAGTTYDGTTQPTTGQRSDTHRSVGSPPPGWSLPQPDHIPEPTYWPMVLALGITLIMWGVVTTFLMSLVGLLMFIVALVGWINEMRRETEKE